MGAAIFGIPLSSSWAVVYERLAEPTIEENRVIYEFEVGRTYGLV
jgi:hypothetical protein